MPGVKSRRSRYHRRFKPFGTAVKKRASPNHTPDLGTLLTHQTSCCCSVPLFIRCLGKWPYGLPCRTEPRLQCCPSRSRALQALDKRRECDIAATKPRMQATQATLLPCTPGTSSGKIHSRHCFVCPGMHAMLSGPTVVKLTTGAVKGPPHIIGRPSGPARTTAAENRGSGAEDTCRSCLHERVQRSARTPTCLRLRSFKLRSSELQLLGRLLESGLRLPPSCDRDPGGHTANLHALADHGGAQRLPLGTLDHPTSM